MSIVNLAEAVIGSASVLLPRWRARDYSAVKTLTHGKNLYGKPRFAELLRAVDQTNC